MEKDEFFSVVLRDTGLIVHIQTSYVQIRDDDSKQEFIPANYMLSSHTLPQLPVSISPSPCIEWRRALDLWKFV